MPRSPGPAQMQRNLDRVIAERLRRGKATQVVAGEVVEVDLGAAFLEVARKRLNDLGVSRPATPNDKAKNFIADAAARMLARRGDDGDAPPPDDPPPDDVDIIAAARDRAKTGWPVDDAETARTATQPPATRKASAARNAAQPDATPDDAAIENALLKRRIAELKGGTVQ